MMADGQSVWAMMFLVFAGWRVAHPFLPDVFHFLLTAP
jgi:hypothetical protein